MLCIYTLTSLSKSFNEDPKSLIEISMFDNLEDDFKGVVPHFSLSRDLKLIDSQ